jgi:glycosyl transferase family 1
VIVAYRGNFRVPWTTETHVSASLEALGHRVVRLQEDRTNWMTCLKAGREADLFLWQKTWSIDPDGGHRTLKLLREAGTPSVSFHLDRYIGLARESQLVDDPFWRTDLVFTADGGHDAEFADYNVNHRWLPPAVHEAECAPVAPDRRRFPHPVIFVGSHPYPHPEWRPYRDQLIEACSRFYGSEFGVWPEQRGHPIRGRDLAVLYASAEIVVGDSCLNSGITRYWSDRIPETLGRGGFLIHPEVDGLEDWYEDGRDLRTYPLGDFGALIRLVHWYRRHPGTRAVIAERGRATVLGRDTYRHRMLAVLETVEREVGFPPPRVLKRRPERVVRSHAQRRHP